MKRKQRLAKPRPLEVEHIEHEGLGMFAGALALGLEGIVAQDSKSPYVEGPRETWALAEDQEQGLPAEGK